MGISAGLPAVAVTKASPGKIIFFEVFYNTFRFQKHDKKAPNNGACGNFSFDYCLHGPIGVDGYQIRFFRSSHIYVRISGDLSFMVYSFYGFPRSELGSVAVPGVVDIQLGLFFLRTIAEDFPH